MLDEAFIEIEESGTSFIEIEVPATATPCHGIQICPGAPQKARLTRLPLRAHQPMYITHTTHLTEKQAQNSLLQLAEGKALWRKKAAREMVIVSISSTSSFHYQLKTFTEARNKIWASEPYSRGAIDGPSKGDAPRTWSIPVKPDAMFMNHVKYYKVPHTTSVRQCDICVGNGKILCFDCNGKGKFICNWCGGKGYQRQLAMDNYNQFHYHYGHQHCTQVRTQRTLCINCVGKGHQLCRVCSGYKRMSCTACNAKGKVKCFVQLKVVWTVHTSDYIIESTALPKELLKKATGKIAFEESSDMVDPISHSPDPAVNSISERLVQQHKTSFPNEKILMQRHRVLTIPVSEVEAIYKNKVLTYWVYGNEKLCYAPDYPQLGCTIL